MRHFRLFLNGSLLAFFLLPHAHAVSLVNSQSLKPGTLPPSANVTVCGGVLNGREIFGDLLVSGNRNCTLDNTAVHGNVTLSKGSSLVVRNSNIQGALRTTPGFARLALSGAIVGGSLDATAGGSVNLNDSQGVGTVSIQRNTGSVRITRVTLNKDLNCVGNRMLPTGTWIRVDGVQTGQCRKL